MYSALPAAAQRSRSASKAACWCFLNVSASGFDRLQKSMIVAQAEFLWLDAQRVAPARERITNLQQLLGAHRIKSHLIEEAQQPRRPRREFRGGWKVFHICSVRPTN